MSLTGMIEPFDAASNPTTKGSLYASMLNESPCDRLTYPARYSWPLRLPSSPTGGGMRAPTSTVAFTTLGATDASGHANVVPVQAARLVTTEFPTKFVVRRFPTRHENTRSNPI